MAERPLPDWMAAGIASLDLRKPGALAAFRAWQFGAADRAGLRELVQKYGKVLGGTMHDDRRTDKVTRDAYEDIIDDTLGTDADKRFRNLMADAIREVVASMRSQGRELSDEDVLEMTTQMGG